MSESTKQDRKQYTARNGQVQIKPSIELLTRLDEEGGGFCLACGEGQEGCEPDMRRGLCDACGEPKVYGAAELVLMDLYF